MALRHRTTGSVRQADSELAASARCVSFPSGCTRPAARAGSVKLRKDAEAGIPHYWIVEEDGRPVVHVFEPERALPAYAPAGVFAGWWSPRCPS
ncbi:hypothetical protein ACIRVF_23695 [Kitasatospora sp. NPDC101157]|uniref:hypothetical protein n=1 Tax=Kitasatospora sp. NPDC101157 TaxID=3364098 RepID=UPI00380A2CC4